MKVTESERESPETESAPETAGLPDTGSAPGTESPDKSGPGASSSAKTTEGGKPNRKRGLAVALSAVGVVVLAAISIFIFTGTVALRAERLARALIDGDGTAAVRLLPAKVISEAAAEAGIDETEAKSLIARRLDTAVSDYGPVGKPEAKAGDVRELAGRELEAILDLYAQIGIEPSKAAEVRMSVTYGGESSSLTLTMVKVGLLWYADYTSLDDLACRIAGVGK